MDKRTIKKEFEAPLFGFQSFNFPASRNSDIGINRKKTRVQTASIIVASDGTGDFENIQEAINSLEQNGGYIEIKEGIYTIKTAISVTANTKIKGTAGKTIIQTTADIIIFDCSTNGNIQIEGISFIGENTTKTTGIEATGNRIIIENCNFKNLEYGISIATGAYAIIQNNIFEEEVGTAIAINGTQYVTIQNNIIEISTYAIFEESSENTLISNNQINTGEVYLSGEYQTFTNNTHNDILNLDSNYSNASNNHIYDLEVSGAYNRIIGNEFDSNITNNGTASTNIFVGNRGSGITLTTAAKVNANNYWN